MIFDKIDVIMFEGEKVILRGVELSDLDSIMESWNTLELRTFLSTPMPFSREEEENWIKSTWERRRSGQAYIFAVIDKNTKEFLGTAGLEDVSGIHKSAVLGIAIHKKENWSKGFGTDTMRVLLDIGFKYLNLNRIELFVFDFNIRGVKTYLKVGFKEVGKKRQAFYSNGKYNDMIIMDILREDWEKRQ
ncbi:MAG: GNAT family N-acetyltransferase [Asgard group archaeon]|nr:GNAT family N-acetyltransferase [Asgard group archaeon]